jgi:hypothetical protein
MCKAYFHFIRMPMLLVLECGLFQNETKCSLCLCLIFISSLDLCLVSVNPIMSWSISLNISNTSIEFTEFWMPLTLRVTMVKTSLLIIWFCCCEVASRMLLLRIIGKLVVCFCFSWTRSSSIFLCNSRSMRLSFILFAFVIISKENAVSIGVPLGTVRKTLVIIYQGWDGRF